MKRILFIIFLTLCAFPQVAFAAREVLVDVQPRQGTVDDTFEISVTLDGGSGGTIGRPRFESSADFNIQSTGTSSEQQYVNGEQSFRVSFTFTLSPRTDLPPGTYEPPNGLMKLDGANISLRPPKIQITQGRKSSEGERTGDGVDFAQVVDNYEPYVGEQIIYRSELASTQRFNRATLEDLKIANVSREELTKGQEQIRAVGNATVHSLLEAWFPAKIRDLQVPERAMVVEIFVPKRRPRERDPLGMFDDMFGMMSNYSVQPRKLMASGFTLKVKDLPPPPLPYNGYIPVGRVSVKSYLDRTEVKQGDSVTLSVELLGDANLRPYELPQASGNDAAAFKTYVDKPKIENYTKNSRVIFRKTFKVAFVPQRAGNLTLPKFSILVFDPLSKRYEVSDTDQPVLNVLPDSSANTVISSGLGKEMTGEEGATGGQEIKMLAEDIYPQHLGAHTLRQGSVAVSRNWLVILVTPALFWFLLHVLLTNRRKALSDPAAILEQSAFRLASNDLDNDCETFENCLQIYRRYLGNRFRLPHESITSADVVSLLSQKIKNSDLAKEASDVFYEVQKSVYGGGNFAALPELKNRLKKSLQAIEQELK